jgi:hypothetical protein
MATLVTPSATTALPLAESEAAACPSCGEDMVGEYCHACGERMRTPEQLSLWQSMREFADDMFDVDSRAVRSLRLLLFSPGTLTLEYIRGRRRPYLGPLRMYLAVFALTLFMGLLLPQTAQRNPEALEALLKRLVHTLAVRRGITDAAAEKLLQQTTAQHVTWLSLLIPLMFAAFLYLFFHRRRRWFGEHLVFATHFGTINFLVALFLIPFQLYLMRFGSEAATVVTGLAVIPLFAWMMIAVRRVYGTGRSGAVLASLGLFLAFSIAQSVTAALALGTAALSVLWLGG